MSRGMMYSAVFGGVAISAAQDLFEIVSPSTKAVVLHSVTFGQTSDHGDAQAEGGRIQIIRGYTTSGSGGSAPTPVALQGAGAAASTVEVNNTTIASNGSPLVLVEDTINFQIGYQHRPTPEERIVIPPSTRLVVRLQAAPGDAITADGTIIFEEIG